MKKEVPNSTIQLALSSIMFFSRLIKMDIKKDNTITKDFSLNKYIKYGNINIAILLAICLLGTIGYILESEIINTIYKTLSWLLVGIMIIEISITIKDLLINNTYK